MDSPLAAAVAVVAAPAAVVVVEPAPDAVEVAPDAVDPDVVALAAGLSSEPQAARPISPAPMPAPTRSRSAWRRPRRVATSKASPSWWSSCGSCAIAGPSVVGDRTAPWWDHHRRPAA